MGYEINFKFYKKKAEGFGYDTESEPEILKVSVGKQWDDIDLNEVAKSVFGQLAKRNILIIDAEVFEYAKKKVSFKMKDDGITIKNRKFSYDITGAIKSEDDDECVKQETKYVKQETHAVVSVSEQVAVPSSAPIRYEIYDPHPDIVKVAIAKKLPFTIGKKYPIFSEKPDQRGIMYGMIYITEDDQGNRRSLNDKHFVPVQNIDAPEAKPNHITSVAVEDNTFVTNGKSMTIPDIYTLGRRR